MDDEDPASDELTGGTTTSTTSTTLPLNPLLGDECVEDETPPVFVEPAPGEAVD